MTSLDPGRTKLYRSLAGRYALDPVGYARDVLNAAYSTPDQIAASEALTRPPYRVLLPAANNVGKTNLLGRLINWHHDSFDPGVVLATAASFRQVRTQLFKEVRASRPFALDLLPRAPAIFHTATHQVIGFSTNKADAFQGYHDAAVLIVMDEASGVHADFWDRGETMFQPHPGHGWLAPYNPNDPACPAYAAEQSGGWSVVRMSALNHPNILAELRGEEPPVPGAVRLNKVQERLRKQCEPCGGSAVPGAFEFPPGSNQWHLAIDPRFNPQIRGLWPGRAKNQIWGKTDWEACFEPVVILESWPVQIGCDIARLGGDRTVIAVRKGLCLIHLEAHTSWPSARVGFHVAERLRELACEYAPPGTRPEEVPVLIDSTGGYGTPVTDYPDGYAFIGVNASERATSPDYPNRRSELWWAAREAAGEGAFRVGQCTKVGRDLLPELGRELTAAKYNLDHHNRRVVDGKDLIRANIGVSPDVADGVNLAWYFC